MIEDRAVTYSLLSHIRNTGTLMKGPVDPFVPLIKRVLHKLNSKAVFKGESILEIQVEAKNEYGIDFPIPVLKTILHKIARDINTKDEVNFQLHNDNSYILKNFYFEDFEEKIQESRREVETIEKLFKDFARINNLEITENNSIIKFIEKNKVSISKYISNFHSKNGNDFTIEAKFVEFFKQIPNVYEIVKKLYLGSIITGFLEFESEMGTSDVELLFDTNFIISLIDLNTPESTHTCNKLIEICKKLGYRFSILKDTIDEIKFLLSKKAENFSTTFLGKKVNPEDIFNACDRRNFNRSDLERIVDNIEKIVAEKGINLISHTDTYKNKAKFSREYQIFKSVRNSKTSALHDATAIYYVKEKRKKRVKEFEKVNCWFVNNSISQTPEINSTNEEYFVEFQNESIKADELLNILWLSNPSINRDIDNDDLIDIGITSIVAFTLNDTLPKASIIRELDDNISKYRDESISDKDILLISTRICNRQLKDIDALNKLAISNKQDFVDKLKEEALKQEAEEKVRISKLEGLLKQFEDKISGLDKERLKYKNKNESISNLEEDAEKNNNSLIKQLEDEKRKVVEANNKLRFKEREKFETDKIRKWRLPVVLSISFAFLLFVISFLTFLYINDWKWEVALQNLLNSNNNSIISFVISCFSLIWSSFLVPIFILKFFNNSNIEAFKKSIKYPIELIDE